MDTRDIADVQSMNVRATSRVGRGSLAGLLEPRADNRPGLRGSATLETDLVLRAGDHLHLVGWIKIVNGTLFISLVFEVSDKRR